MSEVAQEDRVEDPTETDPGQGERVLPPTLAHAVDRIAAACGAWGPSLSPDATQVAYVTDRSGLPRLEVAALRRDRGGGAAPVVAGKGRCVSGPDQEVVSVSWSPDGRWLAYLVAPDGLIRAELHLVRPDGTDRRRVDAGDHLATVFAGGWLAGGGDQGDATPEGGTYVSSLADGRGPDAAVQVTDVASGTSRTLPAAGFQVVTSASARHGVAVVRRGRRGRRALWLVDLSTGGEGRRLLGGTVAAAADRGEDGVLLPDGRAVLLRTDAVPGTGGRVVVARVPIGEDGTPGRCEVLAAREGADCDGFALRPGGDALVRWNVAGRTEMELRTLDGGPQDESRSRIALPPGAQVVHAWSTARDGSGVVVEASGPGLPRSLWWVALPPAPPPPPVESSAHLLACCPPHDLPGPLVVPELQTFRSHDGLELAGWAYRPVGTTGPVPTVLFLHGGPEAQERPVFNRLAQCLLAAGVAVFAPNVRGSDGYGAAFRALDDGPARWSSMLDVRATVDHVLRTGLSAPGRLGVHGWSYGGYLALAALCRWPDLFAAGSSLAGMSDLRTFYAGTEAWMAAASTPEYGDPVADAAMLADISPLTHLEHVRVPVLLAHGDRDTNVPVGESVQAHDLLTSVGGRSELLLLPGEGHSVVGTPAMRRLAAQLTAFFRDVL